MKELLNKWVNRKVNIKVNQPSGGLIVSVVILDIKQSWGQTRFLVSPVCGKGEIWVEKILEINE